MIEPTGWELPYSEQYVALRRELEEKGFEVHLVQPTAIEERGADLYYNLPLLLATPDLVVHVATHLADHALDILETALLARLIGKIKIGPKQGMSRKAVILGPRGEVLREVQLPPGDEAGEDDEAEDD